MEENKIIKPISPSELKDNLEKIIPKEVIESVNEILRENYRGSGSITIKAKEIVNRISSKMDLTRETIYSRKYLDFENLYHKYGWNISYEQPDRDQSFDSYYTFTPKK